MTQSLAYAPPRLSFGGVGLVLALHLLAFWALLRMEMIVLPAPLTVLDISLVAPARPETPQPKIVPPRPRPMEKHTPPRELPVIAAPAEAPSPVAVPVEPRPVAVAPAPIFSAPVAPAPAAPSAPRFDADYLDNPKPVYPPLSRRLGEEGRVVLRVRVGSDGLPLDVAIHAGSGSVRLDQAALDTVRRWKFVPARLGEQAVTAVVLVPIVFSLKV